MVNVLLVYDRAAGKLLREQVFPERRVALHARFEAEEEFRGREAEIEIVVLTARSRDALLRTHGRYWLSLRELTEAVDAAQVHSGEPAEALAAVRVQPGKPSKATSEAQGGKAHPRRAGLEEA